MTGDRGEVTTRNFINDGSGVGRGGSGDGRGSAISAAVTVALSGAALGAAVGTTKTTAAEHYGPEQQKNKLKILGHLLVR